MIAGLAVFGCLVSIRCDYGATSGGIGLEGRDAAGIDRGRDSDVPLSISALNAGASGRGLDALEYDEVPSCIWVAPQDGAAGGIGVADDLGRFFGVARFSVWPDAEVGLAAPV